jgi:AAA+ ATPase superfamily predicted ATPase
VNIQAGKPVTGKDLIGRENEIALIQSLLLQGQSVVIIAPRRFGKTSVVLEILSRLSKEKHFTAYLDLFTIPDLRHLSEQITEKVLSNKKLDQVFRKMGKNVGLIFKNIELKQVIEEFEFVLKYTSPESDEWELLSDSIDFINRFSEKHKRQMYCGLDEFGDVEKLDGDRIVKLFRSKVQFQQNAAYIFSGSSESMMEALFLKKNSPFFRFARVIELGYIGKTEFSAHISKVFQNLNISDHDALMESILDFTHGHPYYTQLILQNIHIRCQLTKGDPNLSFKRILDDLLVSEKNYLEKLWEEVSSRKEHRIIVSQLAEGPGSLYSRIDHRSINISRSLKALKGSGYVIRDNSGQFILSDPLFAFWIRKNVLKMA